MTSEEAVSEVLPSRGARRAAITADGAPADGVTAGGAPADGAPADARLRPYPSARTARRIVLVRRAVLPVADLVALAAAALLAGSGWPAAGYAVAVLLAIALAGLHRLRICLRLADQVPRVVAATALPALLLLPWLGPVSRVMLIVFSAVVLLVMLRAACHAMLRAAHRRDLLIMPALIVGTGRLAMEIASLLTEHSELGLRPIGFVGRPRAAASDVPLLGAVTDLGELVRRHRECYVIASFPAETDAELVSLLRADPPLAAQVYVVPRVYELAAALPASFVDEIWGIPLIRLRGRRFRFGLLLKRIFDVVAGGTLLVVLAPVLAAVVSAIWLLGGRPVFFRQTRVTRNGGVMEIMKVRTVASVTPDTQWTPAVGSSGLRRWLRATHLDELPQLVNVIRGDMSLVGPRPERPFFTALFGRLIPRYDDRHRVRGGITGWAQVHGLTGDTSISDRARFDNYYIEHWSLWLDVVILIRTLASPLAGLSRQRPSAQQQAPLPGRGRAAEADPDQQG